MGKIWLLLTFVYSCILCYGQEQSISEIAPVVVESNKKFFADDQNTLTISPTSPLTEAGNIGYVLMKKSPLVLRNYGGYGALTSVSMHGTGSNHTQVAWNGIVLNSPTTGQADISLLPAGFIRKVEIINGASGSLFGSGTFGGSLNLVTEPDWNNRIFARYSFQAGMFGQLAHMANIQLGNKRFQYHLSILNARAENDFTFIDTYSAGSPERINRNNRYFDAGIMQNVYLNAGRGHHVEAGMWYQKKLLHIPSVMGTKEKSNARQKDSLFRAYISYRLKKATTALQVRSAYLSDNLNYTNGIDTESPAYIKSIIQTSKILNEADFRQYISEKLIAGAGISNSIINGQSENYSQSILEVETAVYMSLKYIGKNFIINTGFRKEFYEGLNPLPQLSAGIRYMPIKKLVLRVSVSTKFRKPSLNEKYWHPGGNVNLNPEKGRGGELSAELTIVDKSLTSLSARITGYYQVVDNWIQWIIRDSLTPVEYKKVHSSGLESWIDYSFSIHPFVVSGFVNYNYNSSVIKEVYDKNPYYTGNQMIYVPVHSTKAAVNISFKHFTSEISGSYTGKRETAETGDSYLELAPYTLWDASIHYSRDIGAFPAQIGIQCDNLFDISYEIIRSYPVPGRTLRFVITVGFQKNHEKVNSKL